MVDFLNAKVETGSPERKLRIKDISKKTVKLRDDTYSEKIIFSTVEESSNKEFEISDAYTKDRNGKPRISGLWYIEEGGKISKTSALAKVLLFYNLDSLKDMLNAEIVAYPDENNFLVLLACELN